MPIPAEFAVAERICVIAERRPAGAEPRFAPEFRERVPQLARHWIVNHTVAGAMVCPTGAPPPEGDIPPETPLFSQRWYSPFPDGFGFSAASAFPGGDGANVSLVDIEYAWDVGHEDLGNIVASSISGEPEPEYAFHGNGVLGILAATENEYGVQGGSTGTMVSVAHPDFVIGDEIVYDVARALLTAVHTLSAGDVVLIEQQVYGPSGEYLPATWDVAVRDVADYAAKQGITVVAAAGNGSVDLDDPEYEGAFAQGSTILVGAGEPSDSADPRAWDGSNFGAGVAVQGWGSGIVTAGGDAYHDLFFPNDDPNQAYTSYFGGSSGASAIVASMVAVIQSVAIQTRGAPLDPAEVRALLVASGDPESGDQGVGPQPNLLRALRTWFVP